MRPPGTAQEPGANDWADSTANVHVQGTDLLLSIVKDSSGRWASSEVDNQQHLGYGTYRWVVATDLSTLDANEVLGMFTYGGSDPSNNEIDIEPSHWGDMSNPSGSATVWQNANAGLSEEHDFNYSNHPPYVNQFTWSPGRIDYLITDATGATLLAWTVTTGVPTPSTEVPVINYWRYNNVAPAGVRTMRISSFGWAPPGQSLPPATTPPPAGGPGAGSPPAGTGGGIGATGSSPPTPASSARRHRIMCIIAAPRRPARLGHSGRAVDLTLWMQPIRFPLAAFTRDGVLRWSATGAASVDLILQRRIPGADFVRMGVMQRFVRSGKGRIRLPHSLGRRHLGRGTYGVAVRSGAQQVRCAPARLVFTLS